MIKLKLLEILLLIFKLIDYLQFSALHIHSFIPESVGCFRYILLSAAMCAQWADLCYVVIQADLADNAVLGIY